MQEVLPLSGDWTAIQRLRTDIATDVLGNKVEVVLEGCAFRSFRLHIHFRHFLPCYPVHFFSNEIRRKAGSEQRAVQRGQPAFVHLSARHS